MKRWFCMAVAMVFLLGLASGAMAAPGDTALFSQEGSITYVDAIAVYEDALYLRTYEGLYRYQIGDEAPTLLGPIDPAMRMMSEPGEYDPENAPIDVLFAGEDGLYGLSREMGFVYRLSWGEGEVERELVGRLDWADMMMPIQGGSIPRARAKAYMKDGFIYLLRMEDDFLTNTMVKYDLNTGKATTLSSENIGSFTPYSGDALLVAVAGEVDQPMYMAKLDMQSGSLSKIMDMKGANDSGLSYNAEDDVAYFVSGGEIYACPGLTEKRHVGYIQMENMWEGIRAEVLPGGHYVICTENGVVIRAIDPNATPGTALRVSGYYMDSVARKFAEQYPDIPLVLDTQHYENADKIQQNMMAGEGANDLYAISLGYQGYYTLAEKGYALDLSDRPVLRDMVEKLYPDIADALHVNGKLYGVVYELYASSMGYSPKVLKEIGLTEEDLPKTYIEFLDFLGRWEREFADQYPDLSLFDDAENLLMQQRIFGQIFSQYMAYYSRLGENLTYDTELFQKLLHALENADYSSFMQEAPEESGGGNSSMVVVSMSTIGGEDEGPTALFSQYHTSTLSRYRFDDGYEALPLALDEGVDPIIETELQVFLVNPNSKNIEQVLAFLEYYAQNMDETTQTNFMPGRNDPVMNPDYDEMLASSQALYDESKAAYDAAVGTESEATMKLALTEAENVLKAVRQFEWSATEEDIAAYRELAQHFVINRGGLFYDASGEQTQELSALIQRYIDRQIPAEQFIRELDKKIQMMILEGK